MCVKIATFPELQHFKMAATFIFWPASQIHFLESTKNHLTMISFIFKQNIFAAFWQ